MPQTLTTPKPYGGYALTSFKEAGGEETMRFEAYITLNGKKIAHVSNGGRGGSNMYTAPGPILDVETQFAEFRENIATFGAFADEWNKDNEFAGVADDDAFVDRLVEVTTLNRKRTPLFLLDGDGDYFTTNVAQQFKGATREQTLAELRSPRYATQNPRMWDKTACDFIPVV